MNRAVLLTALLGAMGTACLAQAPQLSRSEPANGAVDVPVNIGVIRFHFDRDMDTGKMTLTRHGGETFPPTPQDKPSAWRDARCCELRVLELQPKTTYTIQLNTLVRRGFSSAEGRALPVTTIRFTTGAARAVDPAPKDPPVPCTTVTTRPVVTPQPGGDPGIRTPVQADWRFRVERSMLIEGNMTFPNGQQLPVLEGKQSTFVQRIVSVKDGLERQVERRVVQAKRVYIDPRTGRKATAELAKEDDEFLVTFDHRPRGSIRDGDGNGVTDTNMLDMLAGRIVLDIYPEGKLQKGMKWSYEDDDFDQRFQSLGLSGGRISLKIDEIDKWAQPEIPVARISGKLKCKIATEPVKSDYDADVEIVLPLHLGLPLRFAAEGTMTWRGAMPNAFGQLVPYAGQAKATFFQKLLSIPAVKDEPAVLKKPPLPPARIEEKQLFSFDRGKMSTGVITDDAARSIVAVFIDKDNPEQVFIDGKHAPDYIGGVSMALSGDGKRVAAMLRLKNGKITTLIDGKVGGQHKDAWCLRFSHDGSSVAYVAEEEDGERIMLNGKATTPPIRTIRDLMLSPDGKRTAYRWQRSSTWCAVIDGIEGPLYRDLENLQLSDDWQHYGYKALKERDGSWVAVVDGKEGPEFKRIWGFSLSRDGKRHGYAAQTKTGANDGLMIDGKLFKKGHNLGWPRFSPDGRLVWQVGGYGASYMVIDGAEHPVFSYTGYVHFSPDGKHIAYNVKDNDEREAIVLDGRLSPWYAAVETVRFLPDGSVQYLAQKGKTICLVRQYPGS